MHTYRAWDGTQSVAPLTPDEVLAALSDGLLSGGIDQALDRALHRGVPPGADGEGGLEGLDSLRDRLRAERKRLEESDDLRDALEHLAEELVANGGGRNNSIRSPHACSTPSRPTPASPANSWRAPAPRHARRWRQHCSAQAARRPVPQRKR